jgi:hypothetical protein
MMLLSTGMVRDVLWTPMWFGLSYDTIRVAVNHCRRKVPRRRADMCRLSNNRLPLFQTHAIRARAAGYAEENGHGWRQEVFWIKELVREEKIRRKCHSERSEESVPAPLRKAKLSGTDSSSLLASLLRMTQHKAFHTGSQDVGRVWRCVRLRP